MSVSVDIGAAVLHTVWCVRNVINPLTAEPGTATNNYAPRAGPRAEPEKRKTQAGSASLAWACWSGPI